MDIPVVAVANGILPRADGGTVRGVFLDPSTASMMAQVGVGGTCLLLPHSIGSGEIYPVGVVSRIEQAWLRPVFNPYLNSGCTALFAEMSGRGRAKASGYRLEGSTVVAEDVEPVDLGQLWSSGYPVIDGSGWQPTGGFTEIKGACDLPITIYGFDLESSEEVEVTGNVGGLVPPEKAHTLEHAIIRCLREHALCTPKNLAGAIEAETAELKESLEIGFTLRRPEVFGLTQSGQCGNPLTNLAHFYLAREVVENLKEGQDLRDSLEAARLKALSRISGDLGLSTEPGIRVLQGLKKGMMHDDTRLTPSFLKKVLKRFPRSPWN
ncbi:MAG: hypothetical protein HPY55_10000 [Firmicutes bacterium]|nr:hypothetical protein [Bacillota bacterium]